MPEREKDDIPAGLADKWEKMRDLAAGRLFDKRARMKEVIGARPYRGLPVKDEDQLSRFSQIWHDQQALSQVLQENATFKPDGRVLLPRALLDAMRIMTKKLRESGVQ